MCNRVFAKAMVCFLFFSTLALIVGMVVAHVVQPAAGMNVKVADLDRSKVDEHVTATHQMTVTGLLMDIIPKTLVSPSATSRPSCCWCWAPPPPRRHCLR